MSNYTVTIRFSINSDKNSAIRNSVANKLTASGFTNTGTGTWNSKPLTEAEVATVVSNLSSMLGDTQSTNPGSSLDHYWVNVDRIAE